VKKFFHVFLIVSAVGVLLFSFSAIKAQEKLADFEIIVTVTEKGVEMKSLHGCAWEKASWSAGRESSYSFKVDESGVSKVE